MLRSVAFPRGATQLHTEVSGTAPPDAFGPFRVLHQIGAGALGPVFRAYSPEQDRLVAVKLFRLDLPPERAHLLAGVLEQIIAADLTHPAIAAPLAAGISGTNAYLAQDFVAADSLDIIIRNHGPAPPHEALRVATQIAGALDFAAVVNVLHGTLHPRDVLVAPDDTRLTGLGIAQALDRAAAGTPVRRPYTAPERAAGGAWDRRADVFSLAALVLELLSGRRIAGTGEQAAAGIGAVAGADSAALRAAFARALADQPQDRFPSALAFAEALRDAFPSLIGAHAGVPAAEAEPALPFEAEPIPLPRPESAPVDDLELVTAGEQRYRDVETSPAFGPLDTHPAGAALPPEPVAVRPAPAAPMPDRQAPRPMMPSPVVPPPRSRLAVWPVVLALLIGATLGYVFRDYSWNGSVGERAGGSASTEAPETSTATSGTSAPERVEDPLARAPGLPPQPAQGPPAAGTSPDTRGGGIARAPARSAGRLSEPSAAARNAARAAPAPRAPVPSGSLLVRSTPAGARVFIDGRAVGETPLAIRELGRGRHAVRVARDGYVAQERTITLTAAEPSQSLTMELLRDAPPAPDTPTTLGRYTAPLLVESRPAGASVYLDGKLIGKTPLMLAEVPIGSHAVRLELSGFNRWSASVRVVAGERNRVAASLEQ